LRRNPREFGYTQNLWDGKILAHHLEESHDVAGCTAVSTPVPPNGIPFEKTPTADRPC
jgi:hypothetical protein